VKHLLRSREALVTLLLVFLIAVTGLFNPNFFKFDSIVEIFNASLTLVLISLGEMFVILTRGIDVSVGAIAGLAAVVLGTTLNLGWPMAASLLAAVATGTLAGAFNAFGITFLRVPPIIMTLGTLGIYRGLMRIITGGSWIENLPQSIKEPNLWDIAGIPFYVWLTFIVIAITVLYWGLINMASLQSDVAAWIAILVAFTLRLMVLKYKWQTQPVMEVRLERKLAQLHRGGRNAETPDQSERED
jgi:AI-2 transport system permease protein